MQVLIIRVVLGIVFGVLITRALYPKAPIIFTIGLCAVLVALAYLSEYLRRKKKGKNSSQGERRS